MMNGKTLIIDRTGFKTERVKVQRITRKTRDGEIGLVDRANGNVRTILAVQIRQVAKG